MSAAAGYMKALSMLESIAGADVLKLVDPGKSTSERGTWMLRTKGGLEIGTANPAAGVAECFLLLGHQSSGRIAVATIQTLRALCGSCKQPKILHWPVSSCDAFVCGQCSTQNFVSLN